MGRASELATGRAAVPEPPGPGVGTADGLRVGNSPAALPPGLRLDVELPLPPMVGRVPTGSDEMVVLPVPAVLPAGVVVEDEDEDDGDDEDVALALWLRGTPTLTVGSRVRPVAPAVTVNCTEVSEVALAGTATWARTWRAVDPEKTVPSVQAADPSSLPQPKVNFGVWPAGAAVSWRTAFGTFPFCAHALTTHCTVWPGLPLDWLLCRPTHRLLTGELAAKRAVRAAGAGDGVPAVPTSVVAGVSWGEAGGDAGSVPVSVDAEVASEAGWEVAGAWADVVAAVAGVVAGAGVVGAVVVGAVVGVVGVGVGVGVGDGCSGWQLEMVGLDVTVPVMVPGVLPLAARLSGAMKPLAASPAVVASMMPPAMRPIETGRTRAKHMEDPARDARCSTT